MDIVMNSGQQTRPVSLNNIKNKPLTQHLFDASEVANKNVSIQGQNHNGQSLIQGKNTLKNNEEKALSVYSFEQCSQIYNTISLPVISKENIFEDCMGYEWAVFVEIYEGDESMSIDHESMDRFIQFEHECNAAEAAEKSTPTQNTSVSKKSARWHAFVETHTVDIGEHRKNMDRIKKVELKLGKKVDMGSEDIEIPDSDRKELKFLIGQYGRSTAMRIKKYGGQKNKVSNKGKSRLRTEDFFVAADDLNIPPEQQSLVDDYEALMGFFIKQFQENKSHAPAFYKMVMYLEDHANVCNEENAKVLKSYLFKCGSVQVN